MTLNWSSLHTRLRRQECWKYLPSMHFASIDIEGEL